jgi:hypothetical protein
MAGTIESEAVFRQRCREIGMSDDLFRKISDGGFKTMGSFAYSCSYVPGSADDSPLTLLARTVNGGADLPGDQMSQFRRVFFESFTLAQADLRLRLERGEDSQPRKLAVPERAARYQAQEKRLHGLSLIGELECSDSLVDEAVSQADDNRIKYIPWEKCTRKRDEIAGQKKLDVFQRAADGTLKMASKDAAPVADASNEYNLRNCLTRRALAYDQAAIITFDELEKWHAKMFRARSRPPFPGYAEVSFSQLLRADIMFFEKLAELTREGISPDAGGRKPLDAAISIAIADHEVCHLLDALPSAQKRGRDPSPDRNKKAKGKGKNREKTPKKDDHSGGKGAARKLPEGLEGSATTEAGSQICFAFNFGKCKFQEKGNCNRGKHICTKCFRRHPYIGSDCARGAGA